MLEDDKEQKKQNEDFRKKRQNYSLAIRRTAREEMFAKKRNISEATNSIQNQKSSQYIVDSRFADYITKFHKNRYYLETLPELIKAIYDPDIIQQHYGLIGVRKIMSIADQPPIQPIVDTGIIPKLIEYINQQQYPQLQLEATWALTNVASGTPQQCQSIVDKGAIPLFIKLLKSQSMGIVEQAVWAIGNIASDSSFHRDTIIRHGGIQNMIFAIKSINDSCLIEHSAWALSNMCRGQPLPSYELIKEGIPVLVDLISRGFIKDKSILADCFWAINYNTNAEPERIQMLINMGLVPFLVRNLQQDYYSLLVPTIRIVGHITMGLHHQTSAILAQPNFFDCIYALLLHQKRIVRGQTCWIVSNIAAGNTEQVDQLLSRDDILGQILKLFQSDSGDVRRQISHIFSNLTAEGDPKRVFNFFKNVGLIRFYLVNLTSQDYRLLRDCLTNLYSILKLADNFKETPTNGGKPANLLVVELMNNGGIPILEQLQMHSHNSVYEAVVPIVKEFFESDEGGDI